MKHKDPAAEHDDCKVHNSIVDRGGEAIINVKAFKTCRYHCLDAKTGSLSDDKKKAI